MDKPSDDVAKMQRSAHKMATCRIFVCIHWFCSRDERDLNAYDEPCRVNSFARSCTATAECGVFQAL
jgi:hypothetical protein